MPATWISSIKIYREGCQYTLAIKVEFKSIPLPVDYDGPYFQLNLKTHLFTIANIETREIRSSALLFTDDPYYIWTDLRDNHPPAQKAGLRTGPTRKEYLSFSLDEKINYFCKLADDYGMGRVSSYIRSTIFPALHFVPLKGIPIRFTKLGGLPVASPEFVFPKDDTGRSAIFIGQVDLGELKTTWKTASAFPGNGILYFFGSIGGTQQEGSYAFKDILIRYEEPQENRNTIQLPADIEEYGIFQETSLKVLEKICIPDYDTALWGKSKLTDDEMTSFMNITHLLYLYYECWVLDYPDFNDGFVLLGYPDQHQGCIFTQTERKIRGLAEYHPDYGTGKYTPDLDEIKREVAAEACQWKLLFQLDLSSTTFKKRNAEREFDQSSGALGYLMIRAEDLQRMDLSNTETVWQSA